MFASSSTTSTRTAGRRGAHARIVAPKAVSLLSEPWGPAWPREPGQAADGGCEEGPQGSPNHRIRACTDPRRGACTPPSPDPPCGGPAAQAAGRRRSARPGRAPRLCARLPAASHRAWRESRPPGRAPGAMRLVEPPAIAAAATAGMRFRLGGDYCTGSPRTWQRSVVRAAGRRPARSRTLRRLIGSTALPPCLHPDDSCRRSQPRRRARARRPGQRSRRRQPCGSPPTASTSRRVRGRAADRRQRAHRRRGHPRRAHDRLRRRARRAPSPPATSRRSARS